MIRLNTESPQMHDIRTPALRFLLPLLVLCGLSAFAPSVDAQTLSVSSVSQAEGSSGGNTNMDFTVTLSPAASGTVTVHFDTTAGSATSGADFTAVGTTVTFLAGETSKVVSVPIVGDTLDEGLQETFTVALTNPVGASVSPTPGTGTIVDDDAYLSVSDVSALEGTATDTTFAFSITLGQAKSYPISVTYTTANGVSAHPASGSDYTAIGSTVATFTAGQTSKTVNVTVTKDAVDEFDEDFLLLLSAPTAGATLEDAAGVGLIQDDDATLHVDPHSQQEGTAANSTFAFTVRLTRAKTQTVTVTAAAGLAPGAPGAGFATASDFTGASTLVTFSPGETSHVYNVTVSGDGTDEPDETFAVNLSAPSANATLGTPQALGTIVDDDATVSINDVSLAEGSGGGTTAFAFTISLLRAKPNAVTVSYATADGSASSPLDYAALPLTPVTFAPGEVTKTVTVNVVKDDDDELPAVQTFFVNLSNASANAFLSDAQGQGSITDDDPPELRVIDGQVTEGNPPGTVNLQLMVTLSSPAAGPVTVTWDTADDTRSGFTTATAFSDYTVPGVRLITFPAGSTTPQPINITVVGDLLDEDAETMQVNLSGASGNAVVKRGQGFGQIDDNDPPPTMTIADPPSVTEGNSGTTPIVFTVALSAGSGRTVTVNYALGPGGTATAGTDFQTLASGTLTFNPGQTSKTITVNVIGDTVSETTETFFVRLSNPVNTVIVDDDTPAQATGSIVDDDPPPTLSIANVSVTEGNAGTTDAVFTVTLSAVSGQQVRVSYHTVDATAVAGQDYTAVTGQLTFLANTTTLTQTITVPVTGEELDESDETFYVDLASEVNAAVTQRRGEGQIVDDDNGPVVSISDVTVTEPDPGTSLNAVFTVSLSVPSSQTVTVNYATVADTAAANTDFNPTSGTLTFLPGVTSRPVTVSILGDDLPEANEVFRLALSSAVNASLFGDPDPTFGTGTINDDDEAPKFTIDDVTVVEGNTGSLRADFTVSLDKPSGQALSVRYATASPTGAIDAATAAPTLVAYKSAAGSISVPSVGPASPYGASIQVPNTLGLVTKVTATLTGVTHAFAADLDVLLVGPGGQAVMLMSDVGGNTAISNVTYTFDDAGATFSSLASGTYKPTNVSGGGGGDNFPAPAPASGYGTLLSVFNGSDPGGTWRLYVTDDLGGGTGSITGSWTINLQTDDGNFQSTARAPIAIQDNTVAAPYSDNITVPTITAPLIKVRVDLHDLSHTFTTDLDVLLVGPQGQKVVLMSDAGGSNPANNVTLTFDDAGDALTSSALATGLYRPTNLNPSGASADVYPAPAPAGPYASALSAFAGTNPTGTWKLFVVDDAAGDVGSIAGGWTLHLQTLAGDYEFTAGRLRYLPGETTKRVTVFVDADVLDEENERFSLNLSNAVASVIDDPEGEGVIVDDDVEPSLSIADVTMSEGLPTSGGNSVSFTASLSEVSGRPVTVDYATADITAQAGDDYEAASGTLTFPPGVQTQTVTVVTTPDIRDEIDEETFAVDLTNPTHVLAVTKARGVATITDDDPPPAASVSDASVTEGNSGSVDAVFTVSLSNPSSRTVSLSYVTADAAATAGADYTAVSGRLTFLPGELVKTVVVPVLGDLIDEDSGGVAETFNVLLGSPTLATIADGLGVGTITDDDAAPSVSVADISVNEGTGGATIAQFVVSLSRPSSATVTMNYTTVDGSGVSGEAAALDGLDYTSPGIQALSFPPGTTTRTVSIPVNSDGTDEPDAEVFRLVLSNLSPTAVMGDAEGRAVINDDDEAGVLSISDVSTTEGDSGSNNAVFTVALTGSTDFAVTVHYATADGTAQDGSDYTATSGTLTFPAGTTTQTVSVPVTGDVDHERAERFFLNLSTPTHATLQNSQAWATILNDDAPPTISIADVSVAEGNAGSTAAVAAVTLSVRTFETVSVTYATSDVDAVAGTDYTAAAGTITIPAGSLGGSITVPVTGDLLPEANETFRVTLTSPVGATLADGLAVGTITDDDIAPSLSVNDLSVVEADSGTMDVSFTVSLSGISGQPITVDYGTADGTAQAGADYTAASGTLTFAPGELTHTVTVQVTGDDADEPDETVLLNLTAPVHATLADGVGQLTLRNNDLPPTATIDDIQIREGSPGATTDALFTVTLSRTSGFPVSIRYLAADGTATSPLDFAATTGILTIAPGNLTGAIPVPVVTDAAAERSETLFLNLSVDSSSHVTLLDSQAQATVVDDDSNSDFDRDGKSDLLWQNKATGVLGVWRLDGVNLLASLAVTPVNNNPAWKAVATGDFDMDGKVDIVLRNSTTGALGMWFMNGVTSASIVAVNPAIVSDLTWKIAAAADFNGDGRPDLLWRRDDGTSAVWYMNGAVRTGSATVDTTAGPGWDIVGTGDFDQDGKPDILWQSKVDGRVVVWYMDGIVKRSASFVNPSGTGNLTWKVRGVGDYNGDTRPDIVWQQEGPGNIGVWYMKNLDATGSVAFHPSPVVDQNWVIVGPR